MAIGNLELVEERDGWALYRCGQPDEDGFRELLRLGVKAIVKLDATGEFSDTEEARLFAPGTVDFLPLTTRNLDSDSAREAVRRIQRLTEARMRVAVHCSNGRDRTGFVVAAWRILVCGWSVERADEERRRVGPTASDQDVVDALRAITDPATLSDAELQELGLDSDYLTRLKDPKS